MWEILSLARHTFRESLRKRVMLIAGLYVVVLLVSTTLAPADFPEARPRLALTVALKGMALFGLVTVVFLAATVIPDDVRQRTIYSLLTKPVTRWRLLLGRTLGVVMVAAVLLGLMGVVAWAFVRYTAHRYLPSEYELLQGRRFLYAQTVQVLKGGRVQEVTPTGEGRYWVHGDLDMVARYAFYDILPQALWAKAVVGELQFLTNAQGVGVLPGALTVINPTTGESRDLTVYYFDNKPSTFSFPVELVDKRGNVLIEVKRTSENDALGVRVDDLRLHLRPVSFEWNLLKMLICLLMGLVVAASLAVMGSTVLSPLVSICFGFFVCFLGNIVEGMRSIAATLAQPGTALLDLTPGLYRLTAEAPPTWVQVLNQVVRYLLTGLSMVVPDFRNFYANPFLLRGHSVPAGFIGWALLYFVLYSGVGLVAGWLLFRRREML